MTDLATNVLYSATTPTYVTFRDESGIATDAQLLAFEDTWHWGPSAEASYAEISAEIASRAI